MVDMFHGPTEQEKREYARKLKQMMERRWKSRHVGSAYTRARWSIGVHHVSETEQTDELVCISRGPNERKKR